MPRRCAGLLLFVYVDIGGYGARPLVDGDGDEFLPNPLSLRRLPDLLDAAGWRLQPRRPLLTEYQYWHRGFIQRLAVGRAVIDERLGTSAYDRIFSRCRAVLAALEEGRLDGVSIAASAEPE